jgi:hypothetical protein
MPASTQAAPPKRRLSPLTQTNNTSFGQNSTKSNNTSFGSPGAPRSPGLNVSMSAAPMSGSVMESSMQRHHGGSVVGGADLASIRMATSARRVMLLKQLAVHRQSDEQQALSKLELLHDAARQKHEADEAVAREALRLLYAPVTPEMRAIAQIMERNEGERRRAVLMDEIRVRWDIVAEFIDESEDFVEITVESADGGPPRVVKVRRETANALKYGAGVESPGDARRRERREAREAEEERERAAAERQGCPKPACCVQ